MTKHHATLAGMWLLALLVLTGNSGCTYELTGKVIRGDRSKVHHVDADDPRLEYPGLAHAELELLLDPSSMTITRLAKLTTDERGTFSVPVDKFGAGLLEYELGVSCHLPGYDDLWEATDMPRRGTQLLIVMAQGHRRSRPKQDIIEQTLEEVQKLTVE